MNNPLSFRPLNYSDLPLLHTWFWEPHIDKWWHQAQSLDDIRSKYSPRIDGTEPTHVFIIQYEDKPVGIIQWYHWADYEKHADQLGAELTAAGIDLAIGDKHMIGKGIGSKAIKEFVQQFIFINPSISACVTDPEKSNIISIKAFSNAGFLATKEVQLEGESVYRQIVRLDR